MPSCSRACLAFDRHPGRWHQSTNWIVRFISLRPPVPRRHDTIGTTYRAFANSSFELFPQSSDNYPTNCDPCPSLHSHAGMGYGLVQH
jgi:hypothetical protein